MSNRSALLPVRPRPVLRRVLVLASCIGCAAWFAGTLVLALPNRALSIPPAPSAPPALAKHEALLTIGVIPMGQVWVDGKAHGYAPVQNLRLRAGRHVVAAGDSKPRVRHHITLKAGETRSLVLSLESSAENSTDADKH